MTLYSEELSLVNISYERDAIGQEVEVETFTKILCNVKSIHQGEFYQAAQAGLRPSITFIVHGYEYEGQKKVIYKDLEYKIIRTYSTDFEEIELVCERVGSNE